MRLCVVSSQIGDGRETKTKRRCHKFLSIRVMVLGWMHVFFCSAAPCAQHSVATCAAVAADFGRVGGSPVGYLTAMPVLCLEGPKILAM